MKKIEQINKKIEKLSKERDEIVEIELEKRKKYFYKEYVGKCFKAENSYNHLDKWERFCKVIGIESVWCTCGELDTINCRLFIEKIEIDTNGEASYNAKEKCYSNLIGDKISTDEYNKAKEKFIKYVTTGEKE